MKHLPNLLIVDDIEVNLILIETIIGNIRVNLIKAVSGAEALEKTVGLELALAIIDVQMPEMNGYDLARKLDERSGERVPVIFLTANNINEAEVFMGYSSGAVDYLSKPVSNHVLLSKINVFLDLFNQKQTIIKDAALLKESANEMVRINAALKKSEGRLRDIMFSMADWVWEVDENGNYTYSSKRGPELLGVSHEDIIGKTPFDFMTPEDVLRASAIFANIMNSKAAIKDFETWNIGKNGERICLLTNGVPIIDEHGNFKGYRGVDKDITERKCAEDALRESEQKYRDYIDYAPDGIFVTDEAGRCLEVNEAACSMTGYSEDELLNMTTTDLLSEESHFLGLVHFNQLIDTGQLKADLTIRVKNGEEKWWTVSAVMLSANRFLVFVKDITVRKRMEEEIVSHRLELEQQNKELTQEKEKAENATKKYTQLYDFAPSGYLTLSPEQSILELNHSAAILFGKKRSRIKGNPICSFVSNDTIPVFEDFFKNVLRSKVKETAEIKILTADNRPKYVHIEGLVAADGEQSIFSLIDITDRKLVEEGLKQSEENLADAQRIAHIGSWDWNMLSNTVKWSKEMFRVFDIDPETYNGKPEALIEVIHPDDLDRFTRSMRSNLSEGNSPALEYRVIHKDGSVHTIFAEGRMEFGSDGKPLRAVGTVQDISERKQVEQILRENEARLSNTQKIANLGSWELDILTKSLRWTKEAYSIFGMSPSETELTYDTFLNSVHPDDKEPVDSAYWDAVEKGQDTFETEHRIIRKDTGETRYVLEKCEFIKDASGRIVRSDGMVQDITDRKLAEYTLKVSEEKYRTMLNASPDGIFLINFKGIITDVSDIGIELLGFDNKDELIGESFLSFIPNEGKKTILDVIEKTMNEGIAQNIELRIRKKNESLFLSEASSTLIQGADGKPFSYMIIIRDISQRKKMETKQIHADRMANLGEMASGMAHEINQPLNIISMVMDKILFETARTKTVEPEFLKIKSDKIFENITRIRNIIDHVRAFSRSHDDYILTAFDINQSIENAVSMLAEQLKHHAINLNLELSKPIPQIIGNTFKFEQVIVNLLTNAKDAVLERENRQGGYGNMTIGIKSFQENQFLIVEISDNGIGIGNDDIHNIILPFYTTKEEGKGTGLGLSICYQIIKEMNGTIEVTSDKVNGTVIKLVLDFQKKK